MVVILIIVGLIMLITGIICLFRDDDGDVGGLAFFLGVMGSWFLSGGIIMHEESGKPTAMDVYQNKTTLEITYRNGIPVDSVVVFKDSKK